MPSSKRTAGCSKRGPVDLRSGRVAAEPAVADGRAPRSLRSLVRPPLNGSIVGRTKMRIEMGFGELVLILAIVVVVFGAIRLPSGEEMGRTLRAEYLPRARLFFERRRRWTRWDWAIVILAASIALTALVLFLRGPHS